MAIPTAGLLFRRLDDDFADLLFVFRRLDIIFAPTDQSDDSDPDPTDNNPHLYLSPTQLA